MNINKTTALLISFLAVIIATVLLVAFTDVGILVAGYLFFGWAFFFNTLKMMEGGE